MLAPMSTALEAQVSNRKQDLISELIEHKKNSSRSGAADAVDKIKARLADLAYIVKADISTGWANMGPHAKLRIDEWLAR